MDTEYSRIQEYLVEAIPVSHDVYIHAGVMCGRCHGSPNALICREKGIMVGARELKEIMRLGGDDSRWEITNI